MEGAKTLVYLGWLALCWSIGVAAADCDDSSEFDCRQEGVTYCEPLTSVCDCRDAEDERGCPPNVTDPCVRCLQACFNCRCYHGDQLDADNRTRVSGCRNTSVCQPTPDDPFVVFGDGDGHLVELNLRSGASTPLATTDSVPAVLDLDRSAQRLYWLQGHSDIHSLHLGGQRTQPPEVAVQGLADHVTSFCVDWIHQNVYWAHVDGGNASIYVASVRQAHAAATLVTHIQDAVTSQVIDPRHNQGFLYWTSGGGGIERSGLDGSRRATVVSAGPVVLAIDYAKDRLYWIHADRTVSSSDLSGQRRVLITRVHSAATGLAVFEDSVYWNDPENGLIQQVNKVNGSVMRTFPANSTGGLVVYARWPGGSPCCAACACLACPAPPTCPCLCNVTLHGAGRNCSTSAHPTVRGTTATAADGGSTDAFPTRLAATVARPGGDNASHDGGNATHDGGRFHPFRLTRRDLLLIGGAAGGATVVLIVVIVVVSCKRRRKKRSSAYSPSDGGQPGADLLRRVAMCDSRSPGQKSRFPLKPMTEVPKDGIIQELIAPDVV